jgi:O-antigen ligase
MANSSAHAVLTFKAASSAAIVMVPLVLWAGWRLGGVWRMIAAGVGVALLALAVLAGSRAGLAGSLGAVAVLAAATVLRRETRSLGGGFIAVLVVASVAIGVYLANVHLAMPENGKVLLFPAWLIDPHRQIIWTFAVDLASQHPWVGWGINTINLVAPAANAPSFESIFPVMPGHPHNWLLEVFAETGIIGVVPLVAAVTSLFIFLLRRFKATGDWGVAALLAASGAFWVSSLFNFSFWSAWWQVSYILVLSILASGLERPADAEKGR